jgi:CRISPR-associated protein Cas2
MRQTYIVTYDVCDPKRLRRVFKTLKGYGDHLQLSVFRCELSHRELVELRARLGEPRDRQEEVMDVLYPVCLCRNRRSPRHAGGHRVAGGRAACAVRDTHLRRGDRGGARPRGVARRARGSHRGHGEHGRVLEARLPRDPHAQPHAHGVARQPGSHQGGAGAQDRRQGQRVDLGRTRSRATKGVDVIGRSA